MANDLIIPLPKFAEQVSISAEWITQRDILVKNANEIVAVKSQTDLDFASEILRGITKASNTLEKMRKDLTDPFMDAQKTIKRKSDEARDILEVKKTELQRKIAGYVEAERKRIEAEKKTAEEKQQAEIAAQLAEDEELKAAGLVEEEKPFVPEVTPIVQVEHSPKSYAIRLQNVIEFEVTDESLIPAAFKTFDSKKVTAWLKENKDRIMPVIKEKSDAGKDYIPGIIFKYSLKPLGR